MTDESPAADLARRDEVLELLYWLEGEGFGGDATVERLVRFLAYPEAQVRRTLDGLVGRGEAVRDADSLQYRLTETGRREAARRFTEEFALLLGQGHGQCNDPGCECHTNPAGAAACHAARAAEGRD